MEAAVNKDAHMAIGSGEHLVNCATEDALGDQGLMEAHENHVESSGVCRVGNVEARITCDEGDCLQRHSQASCLFPKSLQRLVFVGRLVTYLASDDVIVVLRSQVQPDDLPIRRIAGDQVASSASGTAVRGIETGMSTEKPGSLLAAGSPRRLLG